MPFTIVRDDLTKMTADAIVNTANPEPVIGSGTDSAVYKAAGAEKLLKARQKIGRINRGEAAVTRAFDLPAKYIIHTVGPIWINGTSGEQDLLRSCYRNSLKLALKKNCRSIAFPLISTGNYGFPKDLALKIVIDTVEEFLTENDMMIYLVVFGQDTARLSEKMFSAIEERIDDEYAEAKAAEEYFPDQHSLKEYSPLEEPSWNMEAPSVLFNASAKAAPPKMQRSISGPEKAATARKSKRSLEELLNRKGETFSQMLLRLINEKGFTNAEAYKAANQDKKLFSKIKKDSNYQPKKKTVMAFAIGLELNLDETKDLLASAGYAFSPGSNFDKVIRYCIEEGEYNIFEIEIILYDLGLETLCNYGKDF